ncbi:darobactin export ABC transporter permease subunit [Photorhabdus kayaii]|uniref:Darobactin export ABC transporter permease subunit n=1 Tax=Photorhabdus kayaii TaxID=230088 RepID=A0ABX0AW75_9GAMM|nr:MULTISPECIES: darobactin export ABC transporter permease subunit [Photorhabdus]MCT8350928.1 darobactin export ABC transporter permease subunit [Photorhabdus kayaii]NDL10342.1 darobactin export ABC transporter permease subunit [Photorhabdus kayaii]NDL23785.1 darobactin export ABC transporter permease subunit [Photorhabdus kayaii]
MNAINISKSMKRFNISVSILSVSIAILAIYLLSTAFYSDMQVDNDYQNNSSFYRVETTFNLPNGEKVRSAKSPLPLIDELRKDERISHVNYFFKLNTTIELKGKKITKVPVFAVNDEFLNTLSPFKKVDTSLGANEIYITEEFNNHYLGLEKPKGKSLVLNNETYIIKDILERRRDSSLNIQAIIAFKPTLIKDYNKELFNWYDTQAYVFIKFANEKAISNLNALLKHIIETKAPNLPGAPFTASEFIHLSLKKLKDMHYQDGLPDEISIGLSKEIIYSSYIAFAFILFSALTNYYNLTSADSAEKRDIYQLKKALGASTFNIIKDSLPSMLIRIIFSTLIFLLLIITIFNTSHYIKNIFSLLEIKSLIYLGIFSIFITFIFISSIHFSFSLRFYIYQRNRKMDMRYESTLASWFRKSSLAIQLLVSGVSIYLVTGLANQYIHLVDLHTPYDNTKTISVAINNDNSKKLAINELSYNLINQYNTSNITLSNWRPFDMSRENITVYYSGQQNKNNYISSNVITADENFTNVWKMKILAGGNNRVYQSDNANIVNALVTKEFLKQNVITQYDDIFNNYYWYIMEDKKIQIRFIQIIDDFNLGAVDEPFRPIIVFIKKDHSKYASLNLNDISHLAPVLKKLSEQGFDKNEIDLTSDLFYAYYDNYLKVIKLSSAVAIFSILLLIIACFTTSMTDFNSMKKELSIMESIGGSIYTNLTHFLSKSVIPIIASIFVAYLLGRTILVYLLNEYSVIYTDSFVYSALALSATMIFTVIIMITTYLVNYRKLSATKFL